MAEMTGAGGVTRSVTGGFAERDRVERRIDDLVGALERLDGVIAAATDNWRTGRHCGPR
ncbi:hypothetical protein AB0L25_34455 [Spirillospora sp. NPDC052242]